jgi:aspartate/methionine/tyrosine aminotransferase
VTLAAVRIPLPDLATRTTRSEERKREVRAALRRAEAAGVALTFPGTGDRWYAGVLDAYHGETGFRLDPAAATALNLAWDELVRPDLDPPAEYRDSVRYHKRQPLILRELVARRLFGRLSRPADGVPGAPVCPDDVIVCPYSSTMLLEEAIATLARPGGVIVCPEGFYKSAGIHVEKYGVRIVTWAASGDDTFAIDPESLARCLREHRDRVCGVLLTLPGNPVVAHYSLAQMTAVARVLAAARVPIVCDMAFDQMVDRHIPIAALEVEVGGRTVRMYDRVLTITGNSKAYNAFGPCKLGAACTGDAAWLAAVAERLTISFQRETTHLVRAVLEHTPESYFTDNRAIMRAQMDIACERIAAIDARYGPQTLRPLGLAEGMFLTFEVDPALCAAAGIATSAQLEDLLLTGAGIDSVALDRTGSPRVGVRLNVLAPRRGPGGESNELVDELFDRIDALVAAIFAGWKYTDIVVRWGLSPVNPHGHVSGSADDRRAGTGRRETRAEIIRALENTATRMRRARMRDRGITR